MVDIRLILVTIILSTFSIASNVLLYRKKDHLSDQERNFGLISIIGSVIILMVSLFFGFKNKAQIRNALAGRLLQTGGRMQQGGYM